MYLWVAAFSVLSILHGASADLPTNYEYFISDGINSGLDATQPTFILNGKNISIYSGAIHYFRVPRAYWRDRLRKLRATGLNTVETYIAWNLHEYEQGVFDFGGGGSDFEDFLYLEEFLQIAQEEDLFVIIRSGPFICAEFEFGGFPSFILRDGDQISVRTNNSIYMDYVTRWFNQLMPILAKYQFTQRGSIIMFQVENEYAITRYEDHDYLLHLRQLMLDNGIVELLVTADNPWRGTIGTIPEVFLMTGNFDSNVQTNLDDLTALQPGRPLMVMEYWSGWYDYWGRSHSIKNVTYFQSTYESILAYPASVNVYMFIGGTNFGFTSGAMNNQFDDFNTDFHPYTTSYDYGAVLAENGDYTDKYWATLELMTKYNTIKTKLPQVPELVNRTAYDPIKLEQQIELQQLLSLAPSYETKFPVSMENMDINNNNGQSYGYVVYRKTDVNLPKNSVLKIEGRVCDTIIVLVNGKRVSPILEKTADLDQYGTWRTSDSTLVLNDMDLEKAKVEIFVENWGRVNVGSYGQYKGIWQGNVLVNDAVLSDWTMLALEFKKSWTNQLEEYWHNVPESKSNDFPVLYKGRLEIEGSPTDTYVYTEQWTKGIVIVNGFVLGRYSKMGPQQSLYLPAPLLKKGTNDILIFEEFTPSDEILFVTDLVYNNH